MENLDHRMPASSLNEEQQVTKRHEKDQQRRRHKQEHSDTNQHHSTQQHGTGNAAISREEKERRRRSADPSMQGENTSSAMARQQAIEDRERQKKADKRRSLAEGPISSSPLSSSPLRNSAGPGAFSQKVSGVGGAISRGQIAHDLHESSMDAITSSNGSANKRRSRGGASGSGRTEQEILDSSLGLSSTSLGVSPTGLSSSSVLNATIHPLLSEVQINFALSNTICLNVSKSKIATELLE